MAVNFIIQRATGGTINLQNRNLSSLSTITKGTQRIARLGEDIINLTVESAVSIPFHIGDRITVFGRDYKLNRLPMVKKEGKRLFSYDLEFEGVQYDLMRATYDLTIDTTNNELQDVQADTLTGNLWRFASVLIANANRVFQGRWVLGELPSETEDKTLTFGETDNCLSVVQRICSEYNIEYDIEQEGDINRLHFRKSGQIFPYTFEYGKGKGLYSLERQNVSSSNIVSRLKVFGSIKNITNKYRAQRLCLPGKTKGESYIEKADTVSKYGIWEATKYFEDVYPYRTGKITGLVSGSVLKFVDNTMNFDLNEKELDGISTKYLLAGVAAKIHFNSGNLSGYEFELQAYDHTTKTFTLKPFKDERDDTFPSDRSAAFQFGVNDEYKILDIALPQSYIDTAEAELAARGDEYYDQNSQPKVQYSLEVAEEFLKELSGTESTTNIFSVGDYIPVKDTDIEVDKSVRIQAFTRDLLNEYTYQLTISDTVTTSITNRIISELIDIDKVIKINNLKDPAKTRRDWRSAQELLDMIFDVEGDYYSEKIKPGSIETQMLSVGAKSTQFGLVGTVIQANYNGNKNSVNVKGGVLTHYTIEEDGRIWNLADNTTTLTGDSTPYYIYAKCQCVGTAGFIIFSTEQIKVEQYPDFYHFFVGVVNSVDPGLNVRSVALTYGFTTVNGRYVRTGRIQSNDATTYFDLDLGEIGGKIKFLSSGSETDLETWAENVDNLQIGGVNLVSNLPANWESGYWDANGNPVSYNGYIRTKNYIPIKANQVHIVHSVADEQLTFRFFNSSNEVVQTESRVYGINTPLMFTTNSNVVKFKMYTAKAGLPPLTPSVISEIKIKLEEGNKATTYSESPEDMQAKIDDAVVKATFWEIKASAPVIYKDAINAATSGAHTPVTVSGELRSGITATQGGFITVTPNGGTEASTATASPVTISPANNAGKTNYTVRLYSTANKSILLDTMTIPVVFKGASGVSAINATLSNEADVLPANPDGNVTSYTGSGTDIRVFEGATELEYDGTGTANGKFNVTAAATNVTAGSKSKSGKICRFGNVSAMTQDNASITFTISGKTEQGDSFSLTKVQSFSKSKTGQKGDKGDRGEDLSSGKILHNDPTFKTGVNNTYIYNNGGGVVSWSRVTKPSDAPSDSTYIMRFSYTSGSPSPGFGGFRIHTMSRVNAIFVVKIIAKIPVGRSINWASNATGDGRKSIWLTSREGTGKYETYLHKLDCGASGTFLDTNYFYFSGGSGVFDVDVAFATVYDMTLYDDTVDKARLEAGRAQLAADGYMRARYIRDWAGRNTTNDWSAWNEIKVFLKSGTNIAQGKPVTGRRTEHATNVYSRVTDNNISTVGQPNSLIPAGETDWVRIDLGQVYYDIDYIQVWHVWSDGRTYYGTKTEISEDGVNWTTVFDSTVSGTYKETEQGKVHTQRYASVMAKLNQAAAVTDGFTTINGGLIATVMILLKELAGGQDTAGLSAIQGELKNNPAFWAGGTYAKAFALIQFLSKMSAGTAPSTGEYENLAKITLLHNGAAKVGDFIIEESGRIAMIDPVSGKTRLMFAVQNLPLIADLMSGTVFSGSTDIGAGSTNTSQILSGSTNVDKDGAKAQFGGVTLTIDAWGRRRPDGGASSAMINLYALRNGVRTLGLGATGIFFTSTVEEYHSDTITINPIAIQAIQSGLYTFELVVETAGDVSFVNGYSTSSTFSWNFTEQNVRYQQYGLDGMMFFYSGGHFHFTEGGFLDGRAPADKWNVPGILAKGRILSSGSRVTGNAWGAKNVTTTVTKQGTGGYRVFVNCPNGNYDVNISPRTSNRTFIVGATAAAYFEVYFRDHNGNLADSEFSYTVVGNNYN